MVQRTPNFQIPCALDIDENGVIVKVLPDVVWLSQTRVRVEAASFKLEHLTKENFHASDPKG
jgi:hypothetical protein